ncbi:MAG TPA: pyridoxal-phosphate dependent enzyme, partial [Methylomirabilota bacterium]|nr:pyridoxal-phosphate dependent enzyme [Methylomirabilota bacterium]
LANVDYVFAPMGSGSLAAGAAIGLKGAQPRAKVVAVQPEGSPAMVESFHAKRPIERPANSIGDCILCRVPADVALAALIAHVDDALLVSDDDLLASLHALLAWAHVLVEPGAAASLAGAWALRSQLAGKRAVILLTGGNVDTTMVTRALAAPPLFDPTTA